MTVGSLPAVSRASSVSTKAESAGPRERAFAMDSVAAEDWRVTWMVKIGSASRNI